MLSKIKRYRNPYHSKNCYLDFNVLDIKEKNMKTIFKTISNEEYSALQVMVSSNDINKIEILQANDFKKVRMCYEMEVTREDLVYSIINSCEVHETKLGSEEYDICARLLFNEYVKKHECVNPLTIGLNEFIKDLPEKVLYSKKEGKIIHFAFVEQNEIAYVGSKNSEMFIDFAKNIVKLLFEEYKMISFEADDIDREAMTLKDLFKVNCNESYDTWIFENIETYLCSAYDLITPELLSNLLGIEESKIEYIETDKYYELKNIKEYGFKECIKRCDYSKRKEHSWKVILKSNPGNDFFNCFISKWKWRTKEFQHNTKIHRGHYLAHHFKKWLVNIGSQSKENQNKINHFFGMGNELNIYYQSAESNCSSGVRGQHYYEMKIREYFERNFDKNNDKSVYYEIEDVRCKDDKRISMGRRILIFSCDESLKYHVFIPNVYNPCSNIIEPSDEDV